MGPGPRFLSNGPKWGQAGGLYEIGPGGLGPRVGRRQERLGSFRDRPKTGLHYRGCSWDIRGCWNWPLPGVNDLDISFGFLCKGVGMGRSEGPTTVSWQAWP